MIVCLVVSRKSDLSLELDPGPGSNKAHGEIVTRYDENIFSCELQL